MSLDQRMRRSETIWKGLKFRMIPSEVTCAARVGSCVSKRSQLDKRKDKELFFEKQYKTKHFKKKIPPPKIDLLPGFFD